MYLQTLSTIAQPRRESELCASVGQRPAEGTSTDASGNTTENVASVFANVNMSSNIWDSSRLYTMLIYSSCFTLVAKYISDEREKTTRLQTNLKYIY